jgi:Alpha/beta hydrolase family
VDRPSVARAAASTVLFVHGAHLHGWCWLLVMDLLAGEGIDCRAIDLPFTGYAEDVRCVRSAITSAQADAAVHVVCHSYAGLPVAEAGHAAAHLTFVAGRLPASGESPAAMTGEWNFPEFQACMQRGEEQIVHLSEAAGPLMFNRTSPAITALAMDRMRPMRSTVPDEPVADPAWRSVPSSYVVCADDRAVRPDAQRARATLVGASVELDADHSPFFSRPRELAAFIAAQHRAMRRS